MFAERIKQKLYDLTEREKELNLLYLLEDILQDFSSDFDSLFHKIVNTICLGWQYPEICVAKIEYENQIYRSDNYKRTIWQISEPIKMNTEQVGEIFIIYLDSDKFDKENPFLEHEIKLLQSIATQISNYIFHRHLLDTFGAWRKAKETLEILEEKEHGILQILKNADVNEVRQYLTNPPKPISNQEELSIILEPHSPMHWKWRKKMVDKIAEFIDGKRFGVKAIYLFGSTKNACAGPGSDIDILIHTEATETQQNEIKFWLEGWSKCLSVINELKTGYQTDGLLDVHFINDEDIANHTSFAVKIETTDDSARLVKKYD